MATPAPSEALVLVHGLWMRGWMCWPLKRLLRQAGFEVFVFSYPSTRLPLAANVCALSRFAGGLPHRTVHFVGHSLGGLLILKYLSQGALPTLGRVVVLGSPHSGCYAADVFNRSRLGRVMLGRTLPEWSRARPACETWPFDVGVIAGVGGIGLGRLFAPGLPAPNDGVVTLAETQVPGARQRVVLPVSHSGMLFSRRVACAVVEFLRGGRFAQAEVRKEAG